MLRKVTSLAVSENVFNILDTVWGYDMSTRHMEAYLDTFNNCRETGYYACFGDDYSVEKQKYIKNIFVWAFECRNSDEIVVITSLRYPDNGMFDEEAYKNGKYFHYNEYYQAAEYIYKTVKEHFKNENC